MRKILLLTCVFISTISYAQKLHCVLSLDMSQDLYFGFDNPVSIIVEKTQAKNIILTADNARITKVADFKYRIIPTKLGKIQILIKGIAGKDTVMVAKYEFKVKYLYPIIALRTPSKLISGGRIVKDSLLKATCILWYFDNMCIDGAIDILSYRIIVMRGNNVIYTRAMSNNVFSNDDEVMNTLRNLQSGDVILFNQIKFSFYQDKDDYSNKPIEFEIF